MKVNSTILSELNIKQVELLDEYYTRAVAKIVASELSLQEITELLEKLIINVEYIEQILLKNDIYNQYNMKYGDDLYEVM